MYRRPRRQTTTERRPRLRRDDLDQLKRLFATVRPYRRHLAIAVVGVIIASSLGLVFPRIMGDLVDTALPSEGGDTGSLDRLALILVVVFLLQAGFNFVRTYFLSAMGEAVVADLRTQTYDHLLTLPVKFFDSRRTGEITSRLTSDVAVVQNTVSSALAAAMAQSITLVGGVVLLFVTSVRLSVTVLAVLPVIIIAAAAFGRRLRRVSTEFQDKVAEANAGAEESIAAVRVVKWFSAEDVERRRYATSVRESFAMALRRARLRAMFTSSVTFVAFSVLAFVVWQGGREVLRGSLSAGDLVAFLIYTLTVAGAIGTFTGLYGQLQEALGASQRIFELLDERTDLVEPAEPQTPTVVSGRVVFEQVGFQYDDRDTGVLDGVSLEAQPGEVVAIVGPSGAGKSTLVQLIPRFFDVTDGTIVIDGIDIRNRALTELRASMTAVPQETQLFSGTIAENLRVGKPEATDAEIENAAVAAHAHEFITTFPDSYETIVGERGIKLSGGQRQRVAIARALLKDPRILILDEATSSLDSEAEAIVQEALETLMRGRTTFVIAHRLSTIRNADRILVLESGRIVQQGTHDELMAGGGLYRDLYEAQFEDSTR